MKKIAFLFSILLFMGSLVVNAQTKVITGTVTSADDDMPIPGVSVLISGTTLGTVTDVNGNYSFKVPEDAEKLMFSFVGMQTQEVAINGLTVNATLQPDVVGIDEVVVTAMGISKEKKALGYSTSNVSADEILKSGEQNAVQALAAKASGIQIIGSAGTPGASSKILIRGNSSFTGENQPLIVVDGVPIDNSTTQTDAGDNPYNKSLEGVDASNRAFDLNPSDIESVTVLKGPAAAALYGVRAANGAIIYTTKKGGVGSIRATYNYTLDISKVNELPDWQNVYSQGAGGAFSTSTYNSWGGKLSDLNITPTDNVAQFFSTSFSNIHNLSISGGTTDANARLSIGRTDLDGVMPNNYAKRTSVRLSGEAKVVEGMKIGGTANYVKNDGNQVQKGSNLSGLMLTLFRAPVNAVLYDKENGGYLDEDGNQRQYYAAFDNPYWSAYNNTFESDVDRIMGNVYANYSYKWLTLDYRLGVDFYTDARKGIIAIGSNGGDAGDGLGEVSQNTIRNREIYSNFIATGRKNFDFGVNTSLSLGHSTDEQFYQSLYGRARVLSAPNFYNLSNGSDRYTDEKSITVRTSALFFIADIDYKNTVFLNVTGRNEWASTLGSQKNNFFYPSVSTSFVFTELLPESDILSFGKVRLGWAKAGNNPSAYGTLTYYTQPSVAAGMTGGLGWPYLNQNGFSLSSSLGNSNLEPEKTRGIEGGLDLRFFNGRANLDFTYYNQKTMDILVDRPISPSTGFGSVYENSGEMVNKGVEITLGITPIQTSSFAWNATLNFTKNKNEVLKLAENVDEINIESAFTSFGSYAIVGKPYGALYSEMWERNENGEMIVDEEGYPIVADERGYVGNPFPDWLANIRNTFTYKNVSLSFLFDIREGGMIWNGTIARLNQIGRTAITADREGTIVVPGVTEGGAQNSIAISKEDYYRYVIGDWGPGENAVYDGSWVRLRDVSLSYKFKFKNNTISKYVKNVVLSASGKNLWLSTDYPGIDPETSLTGASSNLTGFDYFNSPGTKSYIFSVKVDF